MVADIASEIHARRLNAKEVLTSKNGENFIFPIADGTAKLFGRDHEVRESTLRRDQPVMSEDLTEELQGNSVRSQPTETKDDAEARSAGQSKVTSFVVIEPRVQPYVPKEESSPFPLKFLDETRITHTSLYVLQVNRVNDYWSVDLDRTLSDSWTGLHVS